MHTLKALTQAALHTVGLTLVRSSSPYLPFARGTTDSFLDFAIARGFPKMEGLHFVQIGANDGRHMDPLFHYINRYGWQGVLVEPIGHNYARLCQLHRDRHGLKLLRAAIDWESGHRTMYKLPDDLPDAPPWASAVASFNRDHLLNFASLMPDIEKHILAEEVPCLTLSEIVAHLPASSTPDLFVSDTEGFDYQILQMLFAAETLPRLIHFEHAYMTPAQRSEVTERLLSRNYTVINDLRDTTASLRP